MGLAGPALVKAGTGEEIDKEALGGAGVQADRNGLADLAVDSEAEVFDAIRTFPSYFPSNCREPAPFSATDSCEGGDTEKLLAIVPSNLRRPYDVRDVIKTVVDAGSFFKLKPTYAANITTGRPACEEARRVYCQPANEDGGYVGCAGLREVRALHCDVRRLWHPSCFSG